MSSNARERASLLEALFLDTIESLDPGPLVSDYLRAHPIDTELSLIAVGKAAIAMAEAALNVLGDQVREQLIVAPEGSREGPASTIYSTHPTPSAVSMQAARTALGMAERARGRLLVLISGGGSALLALPAEGLELEHKIEATQAVYGAGFNIDELNVVRKHLSAIKGGRLAMASTVPVTTLALSDVVGDDLFSIASGPSVGDPSSAADALAIVERACPNLAGPAVEHLRGRAAEGPTSNEAELAKRDEAVLLAGLEHMAGTAQRLAGERGYRVHDLGAALVGDVETLALELVHRCRQPGLWVGAGESTISLCPNPGCGGRAQQLALLIARLIGGRDEVSVLVAGSDGIDGASDAAGAVVDGRTWQALLDAGFDPEAALRGCDAGTALEAIGATIRTGPTGVNHADLVLLQIDAGA